MNLGRNGRRLVSLLFLVFKVQSSRVTHLVIIPLQHPPVIVKSGNTKNVAITVTIIKEAPVARFLALQTWNPTLETLLSRHRERLYAALSVYTRGIGIKTPRKSGNQLPTSSVLSSTMYFSAPSTSASVRAFNAAR